MRTFSGWAIRFIVGLLAIAVLYGVLYGIGCAIQPLLPVQLQPESKNPAAATIVLFAATSLVLIFIYVFADILAKTGGVLIDEFSKREKE